jgi:hypothetical protein
MSVAEGAILRIVANMIFDDASVAQNVFNAVLTTAGGSSAEADVASDLADWVDDMFGNLATWFQTDITPGEVAVYEYDAIDDDWDEVATDMATYTTSGAGQLLPRGAAAVINAQSLDPDVQGRKYIAGFEESAYWGSGWIAGVQTALAAFASDWVTAFVGAATGATFTPIIWSPTRTVGYPTTGAVTINIFAGYQRRRKEGVGI